MKNNRTGAHIMEYALIIILVTVGIMVMGPYIERSWNAQNKILEQSVQDSQKEVLSQSSDGTSIPLCQCHYQETCSNPPCCGQNGCQMTEGSSVPLCNVQGCQNLPTICTANALCCDEQPAGPSPGSCGVNTPGYTVTSGVCNGMTYTGPACADGKQLNCKICGNGTPQLLCSANPTPGCLFSCQGTNLANTPPQYGAECPNDFQGLPNNTIPITYVDHANNGPVCTSAKCEVQCANDYISEPINHDSCVCPDPTADNQSDSCTVACSNGAATSNIPPTPTTSCGSVNLTTTGAPNNGVATAHNNITPGWPTNISMCPEGYGLTSTDCVVEPAGKPFHIYSSYFLNNAGNFIPSNWQCTGRILVDTTATSCSPTTFKSVATCARSCATYGSFCGDGVLESSTISGWTGQASYPIQYFLSENCEASVPLIKHYHLGVGGSPFKGWRNGCVDTDGIGGTDTCPSWLCENSCQAPGMSYPMNGTYHPINWHEQFWDISGYGPYSVDSVDFNDPVAWGGLAPGTVINSPGVNDCSDIPAAPTSSTAQTSPINCEGKPLRVYCGSQKTFHFNTTLSHCTTPGAKMYCRTNGVIGPVNDWTGQGNHSCDVVCSDFYNENLGIGNAAIVANPPAHSTAVIAFTCQ